MTQALQHRIYLAPAAPWTIHADADAHWRRQHDELMHPLPGLVAAAQANANRGYQDVALFEVGQIFKGDRPENQFVAASGVRHGFASSKGMGRHWSGSAMTDLVDCTRRAIKGTAKGA